jgi:hypothetical protein
MGSLISGLSRDRSGSRSCKRSTCIRCTRKPWRWRRLLLAGRIPQTAYERVWRSFGYNAVLTNLGRFPETLEPKRFRVTAAYPILSPRFGARGCRRYRGPACTHHRQFAARTGGLFIKVHRPSERTCELRTAPFVRCAPTGQILAHNLQQCNQVWGRCMSSIE